MNIPAADEEWYINDPSGYADSVVSESGNVNPFDFIYTSITLFTFTLLKSTYKSYSTGAHSSGVW